MHTMFNDTRCRCNVNHLSISRFNEKRIFCRFFFSFSIQHAIEIVSIFFIFGYRFDSQCLLRWFKEFPILWFNLNLCSFNWIHLFSHFSAAHHLTANCTFFFLILRTNYSILENFHPFFFLDCPIFLCENQWNCKEKITTKGKFYENEKFFETRKRNSNFQTI